uniref:uncharacterized protein LOC120330386 n=1 Tax=Styela clava TaxID=7725 RepID=UPI00193A2794|nr:uncharacterized protein LOC120330386 [Styela clava]
MRSQERRQNVDPEKRPTKEPDPKHHRKMNNKENTKKTLPKEVHRVSSDERSSGIGSDSSTSSYYYTSTEKEFNSSRRSRHRRKSHRYNPCGRCHRRLSDKDMNWNAFISVFHLITSTINSLKEQLGMC